MKISKKVGQNILKKFFFYLKGIKEPTTCKTFKIRTKRISEPRSKFCQEYLLIPNFYFNREWRVDGEKSNTSVHTRVGL